MATISLCAGFYKEANSGSAQYSHHPHHYYTRQHELQHQNEPPTGGEAWRHPSICTAQGVLLHHN